MEGQDLVNLLVDHSNTDEHVDATIKRSCLKCLIISVQARKKKITGLRIINWCYALGIRAEEEEPRLGCTFLQQTQQIEAEQKQNQTLQEINDQRRERKLLIPAILSFVDVRC